MVLACGAGLWLGGASAGAAPLYQAHLLEFGEPGAASRSTSAQAINASGQIVGYGVQDSQVATLWADGGRGPGQPLPVPPHDDNYSGRPTTAQGINASGMVVGNVETRTGGGVAWSGGTGRWIPPFWQALDVNDAGVVVGNAFSDYRALPAQWLDGVLTLLPVLPQGMIDGSANAINNAGVIVGRNSVLLPDPGDPGLDYMTVMATLWRDGVAMSLGIEGEATDINDLGQVVGNLASLAGATQGFLWTVDGVTLLNPLSGMASVHGLNAQGLIVGRSQRAGDLGTATLWESGQPVDLNALLAPGQLESGWLLVSANDINDQGWIVGDAVNTLTGEARGFVLRPQDVQAVPEPPALALMLAALVALGALRRRS